MKKKVTLTTVGLIFLVLLLFCGNIVNFIINIKWFGEVGYTTVYFTQIIATLKLMIPIFIISYLAIWFYYRSLRKSIYKWQKSAESNNSNRKIERLIFVIADLVVSFLISFSFSSAYWYRILQFTNATSFGKKDPIFNLDISFYVFKLPLIETLYGVLMTILVLLVIITFATYGILISKDTLLKGRDFTIPFGRTSTPFQGGNILKSGITKFAGKQLATVSSLIILIMSLGYGIKALNLVYSTNGVVFGAGWTDTHITLLGYKITAVACIIASIIILLSILSAKIKPIILSVSVIIALMIINVGASAITQGLYVKSNERNLESKYIENNIDFTRSAFNLKMVAEKPFNITNDLTKEDLTANKETIDNIKVNSFAQALEFYNQTQIIKYYYKFNDLDVDRYNINGKGTQVFLAPREMDTSTLDSKTSTWSNKHLVYTHGYGVAMNKVASVTSEGQPDYLIKNIPPENSTDIKLTEPRIYFGEKTNDYAVVDNTLGEFDYPKGSGNETNNYAGTAGIPMTGVNKLLFAINQGDLKFLLSGNITSKSKILINRNILDRTKKIAPFLTYDSDPYIVLANGKIYWIIDAYTTSDRYPYSQPDSTGVNYIRNSIKVVTDASNGTAKFYIVDKSDPIAESYRKIFPELFKKIEEVPAEIKEHFRYPEDMFKIQCEVMGKYHVTDPNVFYNGDDLWQIAENQKEVNAEKTVNNASYLYMKLPDETKNEMLLMNYFNVRNKNNMNALFGARMDGENYGKLVLYRLPSQENIPSPYMFKQQLSQDTSISSQITLWDAAGSKVIYGDTVILPIKNSLLYIEPLYLRATGATSIPEMKRVIVSYGGKIVLTQNIETALQQIFNLEPTVPGTTVTTPSTGTTTPAMDASKLKGAKDLFDKALTAQKNGDWATYGDNIDKLGKLLNDLSK
ncbi:MAG: UPF0182 family protein [Clostridiaceae bacterium]|nr:UPF0182 family protein [Clostridiaceae bacterium]